tara:strand:+ start:480 stop:692 length:213 start_codon:yes stop_codon:yes gene_type:complete
MKLTKNEIDTLHWHLDRYIRAHQPSHPREVDHFNRFYKVDKLGAICGRLEKEKNFLQREHAFTTGKKIKK